MDLDVQEAQDDEPLMIEELHDDDARYQSSAIYPDEIEEIEDEPTTPEVGHGIDGQVIVNDWQISHGRGFSPLHSQLPSTGSSNSNSLGTTRETSRERTPAANRIHTQLPPNNVSSSVMKGRSGRAARRTSADPSESIHIQRLLAGLSHDDQDGASSPITSPTQDNHHHQAVPLEHTGSKRPADKPATVYSDDDETHRKRRRVLAYRGCEKSGVAQVRDDFARPSMPEACDSNERMQVD